MAEIRVNDRAPEPRWRGNDAGQAAVLLDEVEHVVDGINQLFAVLKVARCRNVGAAVADFLDYGVAKVYDWRDADRVTGPYRTIVIRRRPSA